MPWNKLLYKASFSGMADKNKTLYCEASIMKSRILFVSTHNSLTAEAKKISVELGFDLHIYDGGIMKNGHIYARDNQGSYDVIVSQGGTTEAIKELVSIPVVSVEIRTVDFLTGLYKASAYGKKIGLFVFESENIIDMENLREMLGIDFTLFPYKTQENFRDQINKAISLGISTLVGIGDCISETGKVYNLDTVVIHSEEKQLREAFISAKNICDFAKREEEKSQRFKMIIDYSSYGIMALDNKENIVTFNPIAEKIFNLQAHQVLAQSIHANMNSELIAEIYGNGDMLLDKLVKINHKQFLMNRLPIIIEQEKFSVVITFQEITELQELEHKVRTQLYKKGLVAKYTFDDIDGESRAIKNAINQARTIGKTNTTILITAETGSGKELFAQSIHNISLRRKGPFVAVNCAAMPENLLESEMFGYEEGAFTGAKKGGKPGLFELAHGGTIFLDEVSEIPLSLQGRLLRVLQEREVLRIGGDYILNVDIRVIAATNADLFQMVKEGRFRQDLYFRLNILDLRIPPLRERKDDIPILVKSFIKKMNIKHGSNINKISEDALEILEEYSWPGNVRELENFAEKMCILSASTTIDEKLVKQLFYKGEGNSIVDTEVKSSGNGQDITIKLNNLKDIENQIIKQASALFEGNKEALAEKLGMSRTTLWKRLKEIEDIKD
jgi:transcriptional regulator with PAS, ATPase and Fis domain